MHRSQRPAQTRTFPENNRIGCALIDASMSRRRPCLRRAQPSLFPPPEYCVYLKEPTRPPRRFGMRNLNPSDPTKNPKHLITLL